MGVIVVDLVSVIGCVAVTHHNLAIVHEISSTNNGIYIAFADRTTHNTGL